MEGRKEGRKEGGEGRPWKRKLLVGLEPGIFFSSIEMKQALEYAWGESEK